MALKTLFQTVFTFSTRVLGTLESYKLYWRFFFFLSLRSITRFYKQFKANRHIFRTGCQEKLSKKHSFSCGVHSNTISSLNSFGIQALWFVVSFNKIYWQIKPSNMQLSPIWDLQLFVLFSRYFWVQFSVEDPECIQFILDFYSDYFFF